MKFGESLWQRSVPHWRSFNIDYGSIKSLIKEQTTPGKGKAISVPGHATSIAEHFEDQLLLVIFQEHERVSRFVKSKWYEINSRLGSIERQLNQIQRRKDGLQHMRDTVAVRRKAARIESDILNVGEEIQHLSRFISSNRLAIRKLLKKYRKWTGLTTLAPKVESKILNQSGSFTKLQLDYALDLYTAYLEAVRSPFQKPVPRQLSVADLAQRNNAASGVAKRTPNSAFDGSDLDFDFALAAEVQDDRSQTTTYWVHKDNAVELRILLLQYMRGIRRRGSTASSKVTVRRGSADEIPATVGAVVLDNPEHVIYDNLAHGSSTPVQGLRAVASARWNSDGEALFSINNSLERGESTHLLPVQLSRERLGKFLNVDSTYQHKEGKDYGDEHSLQVKENAQRSDAARSWLQEHKEIQPLLYTRLKRDRFVGLENQAGQAAWVAFDEDVEFGSVEISDLQAANFFTNAPQHGMRFPHAILTVRSEGDCSNLLEALNESHLTERVKGFSLERHAFTNIFQERGVPRPPWISQLDKDIRHIPQLVRIPSRKSSHLGLSSATMTPKKGSRSGASDSEALSVRFEEDHSESTRVEGNTLLRNASVKQYREEAESAPQIQQRYWNEYDNPEDGDDDAEGGFYVYIDPNAPVYPGQKALEALGRRVKSAFRRPKKPDENEYHSTGDDGSVSSSEDEENFTSRVPSAKKKYKAHRQSLVTRATQTTSDYGTVSLSHPPTDPQRARTTALCLLAAAIIFAILNVLVYTGRRKARVEVHVVVLSGVVASIAFLGIALGIWLRGLTERRTKKSLYADLIVGLAASLIGAGNTWLLVVALT